MTARRYQRTAPTPVATGRPDRTHSAVMEPPPLREGQVRCPACRNGVRTIKSGALARHRDLFGANCGNWTPDLDAAPSGIPAPPVDLTEHGTLRSSPTGRCQDCDRAVSGERRLCGRCAAKRWEGR